MRKRTVTDIATGEIFDRALEQYHFIGNDNITLGDPGPTGGSPTPL
jgi:hypothetical protein